MRRGFFLAHLKRRILVPISGEVLGIAVVIAIVLMIIRTQMRSDQTVANTAESSPKPLIPFYMRHSDRKKTRQRRSWIAEYIKNIQYLDTSEYPTIGAELCGIPTREPDSDTLSLGMILSVEPTASNNGRTFRVATDLSPRSSKDGYEGVTPFLVQVHLDPVRINPA